MPFQVMPFIKTQKGHRSLARASSGRPACFSLIALTLVLLSFPVSTTAQNKRIKVGWLQQEVEQKEARPITLAVLDFGDSALGRLAADKFAFNLKHENNVIVLDRDQVRAAARGAGYS